MPFLHFEAHWFCANILFYDFHTDLNEISWFWKFFIGNYEPNKVLVFIFYKKKRGTNCSKGIHWYVCTYSTIGARLKNLVDELQKKINSKFPRNGTMCKNKWNTLNFDYKKITNYHKWNGIYMCFWDLILCEEKKKFHLLHQFNK
jgi:hypothetical protein